MSPNRAAVPVFRSTVPMAMMANPHPRRRHASGCIATSPAQDLSTCKPVPDLESLIEAEIPHLRRYARALIGHSDDADDLVQACLERALSHSHQWNPARGLRPWLFRIQHNLYVSWLRRRDREYGFHRRYPESGAVEANHEAMIELSVVQDALNRLPSDQRTVILLIALEGLSYEEASGILGIPVGTIRSRLSRGRESLRMMLYSGDTASASSVGGGGE
jgi:RNA polymerase sigma-70 factor (ECF subfamily)